MRKAAFVPWFSVGIDMAMDVSLDYYCDGLHSIDFQMLNQPYIARCNLPSCGTVCVTHCWILLADILLKVLRLCSRRDICLWFLFL